MLSSRLITSNIENRLVIEMLEDQEQDLVRKKRDRRPQGNRSSHRDREHDIFDGLGSAFVVLDAPSRIFFVGVPMSHKVNQSTNQPINQPTNQSTNQSINQPTNQPTNQSINQSTNQSTNQVVSFSSRVGISNQIG